MAVIQPRPTHIINQCTKVGDDQTSFLMFYLSAISRDIDLKFIQDTRVAINSPKTFDLHMSKVKVKETVHFFQIFFMGTSWVAISIKNIKTRASREMTSQKNIKIFYFNGVNVAKHWHVAVRGVGHL